MQANAQEVVPARLVSQLSAAARVCCGELPGQPMLYAAWLAVQSALQDAWSSRCLEGVSQAPLADSHPCPLLDLLHMELLEYVFNFLDAASLARAAQVCRMFRRVRWTRVDLSALAADPSRRQVGLTREELESILSKSPTLFRISGSMARQPVPVHLLASIVRCPTMRDVR